MSTQNSAILQQKPQVTVRPITSPRPSVSSAPTPKTQNRHFTSVSRTNSPDASQGAHEYAPGASIALIGMRGSGMSTLAIMAASALGFRVLDADQYFYKTTSLSRAAYKSAYGISQYRQEELRQMRSMLFDNPTGAVIVCGPGAVEGTGKEWLAEYAKDHLIIYILRNVEAIQRHLRAFDVETIRNLTRRAAPAYRNLSSFEFFNVSDTSLRKPTTTSFRGNLSPRALALKNVEEDFLHFIHSVTRQDDSYCKYKAQHSLSSLPLESRSFTYALTLPLSSLAPVVSEFQGVDMEADAIELTIPISSCRREGLLFDGVIADEISEQIFLVRRNIRLPVICHITVDDQKKEAMDQDEYFVILHHGLRIAPEYLCVDLECDPGRIQRLVASKGRTKIVAQCAADDTWDPSKQCAMIQRAQTLGCDVVRFCREATSLEDNFAAPYLVQRAKSLPELTIPIIAYNTGRLGRMSCYLNSILGPVTHPLVRRLVPDCPTNSLLTVKEAQNAVFSSFLLDSQYFGIYGDNTSKSLSPAMHNAAFKLLGLPHRYEIFVHDSLDELFEMVKDPSFGGVSITAPFKTAIIPRLDLMSDEARSIGAVNTLLCLKGPTMDSLLDRNRAGQTVALFGENTDWIGIHTCVQRNLSPINAVRRRTTALITGAGGMARAAAYALMRLGLNTIFVHNRTRSRAEELVKHFEGQTYSRDSQDEIILGGARGESESPDRASYPVFRIIDSKQDTWPEDANPPTIIVSCVATRDVDGRCSADTSLPNDWFSSPTGGVVIELSYTPLETPLLQQVRDLTDRGWISVDGLQVLPEQGMMQFELFTTRRAPANVMREEVFRAYSRRLQN